MCLSLKPTTIIGKLRPDSACCSSNGMCAVTTEPIGIMLSQTACHTSVGKEKYLENLVGDLEVRMMEGICPETEV